MCDARGRKSGEESKVVMLSQEQALAVVREIRHLESEAGNDITYHDLWKVEKVIEGKEKITAILLAHEIWSVYDRTIAHLMRCGK